MAENGAVGFSGFNRQKSQGAIAPIWRCWSETQFHPFSGSILLPSSLQCANLHSEMHWTNVSSTESKCPSPQPLSHWERGLKALFFRCSSLALWEREAGRVRASNSRWTTFILLLLTNANLVRFPLHPSIAILNDFQIWSDRLAAGSAIAFLELNCIEIFAFNKKASP